MEHIITKIASLTPETPDDISTGSTDGSCDHLQNYMFFRNVKLMKDMLEEICSMDESQVDSIISEGHDWASDHIASATENIEQVLGFLKGETE